MPMLRTCLSCANHKPLQGEGDNLECRANPPSATALLVPAPPSPAAPQGGVAIQVVSAWPKVKPADMCHAWRQRIGVAH